MKYRAGFLTLACAWMVTLIPGVDARHAPQKHAAGGLCKLKEQTALAISLVEKSLKAFDEANGEDLGTWPGGFPELQVQKNSSHNGSNVQCGLLFMAQGLKEVLADQRDNLNPRDESLHKELTVTISTVKMLAMCAKHVLGGECSPKPLAPKMPKSVFDRKQWSHTLLKTASDYLNWMKPTFEVQIPKVKGKNMIKRNSSEATHQEYLEGSAYLM